MINSLQSRLNYGSCTSEHFTGNRGIGKIGTTGFLLGLTGGFHLCLVVVSSCLLFVHRDSTSIALWSAILHWAIYMSLLCLFHFMEFFTTAVRQPSSLGYDSFVVNHSKSYTLAALASWVEFWIETYFLGPHKHHYLCMLIGLVLVVCGQGVRTVAMWTCGEHFDHQIMEQRKDGHRLVTSGIYSILRHPSYFGWFYWSIGTQVLLCNPVCAVLYTLASWQFFAARIPFEEHSLIRFYKSAYVNYSKSTWIGIPFIRSYSDSSSTSQPAGRE